MTTEKEEKNPTMRKMIIGADEAGYGSLAGPMVMVAVAAWPDQEDEIPDSKTVKDFSTLLKHRQTVLSACLDHEIVEFDARYIDTHGGTFEVQRAGLALVLQRLVARMNVDFKATEIIVDGHIVLNLPFPYKGIARADSLYWSVSAASILAKHRQITVMDTLHIQYPQYNFNQHRGYGTPGHRQLVRELGATAVHRRSNKFIATLNPVKGREYYDGGRRSLAEKAPAKTRGRQHVRRVS